MRVRVRVRVRRGCEERRCSSRRRDRRARISRGAYQATVVFNWRRTSSHVHVCGDTLATCSGNIVVHMTTMHL